MARTKQTQKTPADKKLTVAAVKNWSKKKLNSTKDPQIAKMTPAVRAAFDKAKTAANNAPGRAPAPTGQMIPRDPVPEHLRYGRVARAPSATHIDPEAADLPKDRCLVCRGPHGSNTCPLRYTMIHGPQPKLNPGDKKEDTN